MRVVATRVATFWGPNFWIHCVLKEEAQNRIDPGPRFAGTHVVTRVVATSCVSWRLESRRLHVCRGDSSRKRLHVCGDDSSHKRLHVCRGPRAQFRGVSISSCAEAMFLKAYLTQMPAVL